MQLRTALRVNTPLCLAFTGAGGKTTAMFALARELSRSSLPEVSTNAVLISTTTHLGADQVRLADHWIQLEAPDKLETLEHNLPAGVIAVTGLPGREEPNRLTGVEGETLERLHRLALERHIPFLIEADGARLRPLKAPACHEPVIPHFVDGVVVVANLAGLGRPLSSQWVHRPERFARLSGLESGETITRQAVSRVLLHPEGGLKGIPPASRKIALLNGIRDEDLYKDSRAIAAELLEGYQTVLLGKAPGFSSLSLRDFGSGGREEEAIGPVLEVREQIAGILLAAGGATRFGRPKQLLSLREESLVHHSARTALEAGLIPVIVVTGAYTDEISANLEDLPVQPVYNPEWASGQSTSLQEGLSRLTGEVGAAVFLLADQPWVPLELLQALIKTHARTLSPIVAPRIAGRRSNPVLLDRATFPALRELRGDTGARPLFSDPDRYPVAWVDWDDPSLLVDIDTPEDYRRLIEEMKRP